MSSNSAIAPASAFYNDQVVRQFAVATILWGIVGMAVGAVHRRAAVLADARTADIPWLSYGRLRPLHTNAVIFAFGGSALFATIAARGAAHLPRAR